MVEEIEREVKYLLKELPDLAGCKSKRLVDIYVPRKEGHAAIRIRQQGDTFFITKKTEMMEEGRSVLKEETIQITEEDFNIFRSMGAAQIIDKTRYYYPLNDKIMEIDIFHGTHNGLILGEIEFGSIAELKAFGKPDFCIADVSSEEIFAGGVLCGLTYEDIKETLEEFGSVRL